jgi:protocatechuate 3,4-dioxygenase beta subunit
MDTKVGRRRALAGLGAAGLGALLAACGGGGGDGRGGDEGSGGNGSDAGAPRAGTSGAAAAGTTGPTATAGSGTSGLAGMFESSASCSLTPEQMEGPYYIDVDAIRRDIREDREGSPLRLGIRVLDEACEPLADAVVEVWHCDAVGTYSGFERESAAANGTPGAAAEAEADGTRFLRGGQVTDADGIAQILTIYPGWYEGRAVHVHAKAHIGNAEVLTTQLYFNDAISDEVFAAAPYDRHTGRRVRNEEDGIFADGPVLTLTDDDAAGAGHLGLVTITVSRA